MRQISGIAVVGVLAFSLATGALAADAVRKRDWTPPANDSTVGVLGGPRKDLPPEAANPEWRKAHPPAAIPGVVMPKVEAEAPVTPSNMTAAPSLPAAPRPDAKAEGPAVGMPAAAPYVPAVPPTGFLPDHPFVSGLVAGLIGTDLGSILYGGTMQGDSTAVGIGYAARMGVIVLLAFLGLRAVWRMMGGGADDDALMPARRREPSFLRQSSPPVNGRREPTLGREPPQ